MTAISRGTSPSRSTDPDLAAWAGTIDQVEDRLRRWVTAVDPEATVAFGAPTDGASGLGASLYLAELIDRPPLRGAVQPPVRLGLGYCVTTWSSTSDKADRLLVELALDATARTELEVDTAPRPAEFWTALRVTSRPSFTIWIPVSRLRPSPVATRVRHPLVLSSARPTVVAGIVRGPGDIPIPDASVELVGLDRATSTDRLGHFSFRAVPGATSGVHLRVKAKGVEVEVAVPEDAADARNLSIALEL
jgi:hypothetical protein